MERCLCCLFTQILTMPTNERGPITIRLGNGWTGKVWDIKYSVRNDVIMFDTFLYTNVFRPSLSIVF